MAQLMLGLVDFDRAGADRRDLARKIIMAQIRLAERGYSTGGRPSFGFRRSLVTEQGELVRHLQDGERVRMRGCHVVWQPDENKIDLVRRILGLLKNNPANRVARMLNDEGIPSPDSGRFRTDNGVRHMVSGKWNGTTITGIARNPLLVAINAYGRRSMGDQLRLSSDGVRELEETDFREDEQPKVIRNPSDLHVTGQGTFDPVVDPEAHKALIQDLDRRGATQRAIPRSRNPKMNPLGGRVYDMDCGWLMYRAPYTGSFRYKCGLYDLSHGQQCRHNTIKGPEATAFLLSCIRQRLLAPGLWQKLRERLKRIADREAGTGQDDSRIAMIKKKQLEVQEELKAVTKSLARAGDRPDLFEAMTSEFDELKTQEKNLASQMNELKAKASVDSQDIAEVEKALELVLNLTELADSKMDDFELPRQLFDLTNVRLFVQFQEVQQGKRTVNQLAGGVVTFGAAEPPIEIYSGPTNRKFVKGRRKNHRNGNPRRKPELESAYPTEENTSLGNRSRGDRRLTFHNDFIGTGLLQRVLSQTIEFTADTFFTSSTNESDL
ncbi:recombinase family protein [Bremerella alba]|uniref:recombinase family protein n=1 Tax=Bremerella alba TaxID=980252 RepID=UPI001A955EFA|nr:recombinase family protein [Bremerella alba]